MKREKGATVSFRVGRGERAVPVSMRVTNQLTAEAAAGMQVVGFIAYCSRIAGGPGHLGDGVGGGRRVGPAIVSLGATRIEN